MGDVIVYYVILGLCAVALVAWLVSFIVKIAKMKPEERKATLITYLCGLVTMAEEKIGSGRGAEKLAEVEAYFEKSAPMIYKAILKIMGKENFKDLIEEALAQVKKNFSEDK